MPGEDFRVGLLIQHDPGYHTYWKNPGIVGLATQLNWQLPEGFTSSAIQWPYPEAVDMAGHLAHGFYRDVLLVVTISPPQTLVADNVDLRTGVIWMACADACNLGRTQLSLRLPVREKSSTLAKNRPLFEKADSETPKPLSDWTARLLSQRDAPEIRLALTPTGAPQEAAPAFYFYSTDDQVSSDQPQVVSALSPDSWILTLQRAKFGPKGKQDLSGVLSYGSHRGTIAIDYPPSSEK